MHVIEIKYMTGVGILDMTSSYEDITMSNLYRYLAQHVYGRQLSFLPSESLVPYNYNDDHC